MGFDASLVKWTGANNVQEIHDYLYEREKRSMLFDQLYFVKIKELGLLYDDDHYCTTRPDGTELTTKEEAKIFRVIDSLIDKYNPITILEHRVQRNYHIRYGYGGGLGSWMRKICGNRDLFYIYNTSLPLQENDMNAQEDLLGSFAEDDFVFPDWDISVSRFKETLQIWKDNLNSVEVNRRGELFGYNEWGDYLNMTLAEYVLFTERLQVWLDRTIKISKKPENWRYTWRWSA